ncbi:MAG TPA: fumarylacetoacetate hydrolase family protein [Verrucomicrobiae bacterium]|jgi:2-dehydro-3-deoxy-D-arabinonate dehydratase
MTPGVKIFSTELGLLAETGRGYFALPASFGLDDLFADANPAARLEAALAGARAVEGVPAALRPLVQSQEIWAAGVTYYRSRTARMEESQAAGGGSFYDKVYEAERPELFFKSSPHRVAAPGAHVRIRTDSRWNVPEPELTLAINSAGKIFGYTLGNDMSSRDIEGENPLYLPQAKVYDQSAAVGPCLVVSAQLPPPEAVIGVDVRRDGQSVFSGETTLGQIKRPLPSLAEWLFRDNSFPRGCYLMTGTGVVPPDSFTLRRGDEIRISLAPVGVLVNIVA